MNTTTVRALFGLAVIASGAIGCADERPPINRVQANALDKSFFVGADLADAGDDPVFYWRNFVVDGSEGQELVGIGSWSGVDRIRWEITEDKLIARKSYQPGNGNDKGAEGPDGLVVAVYAIQKHFDIKRAYNPSTGEELNVIEENTSDAVWNERKYMRVDWSVNLVDTPIWTDMFQGKVFGDITLTPVAYYQSDTNHEDAPHFDTEQGYFDITSKFLVEPATMNSPFIDLRGQVPACIVTGIYTGSNVETCDPQEAVIRSSYWRIDQVDPNEDYEPFENTTAELDIIGNPGGLGDSFSVGIVTPPQQEWDPQYGYTDEGFKRYMHRHNIWQQSHQLVGSCSSDADCGGRGTCVASGQCTVACDYENQFDGDNNGTNDQCENAITGYAGSKGSQCSARNRCTIPYRDRVVKPIGYWMNKETPAALVDTVDANGNVAEVGPTERMMAAWNQVFVHAVAKAREVECRRTGDGDRASCYGQYFEPGVIEMVQFGGWGIDSAIDKTEVVVTCHNPVRSYDHESCGEVGYSARVGDLRHNFLFYWPHASRAPWGGIANWNADPLTGQIIGASATTMGRSATYAAALVRDIIMVANGELTMEDITSGVAASLYERRLRDGRKPKTYTQEDLERAVDMIDAENVMLQVAPNTRSKDLRGAMPELWNMVKNTKAGLGPASTSQLEYQAISQNLHGSQVEAQMVDPNWLVNSAALSPTTTIDDGVMDLISPLRGGDSFSNQQIAQLIDLRFAARGVCYTDNHAGNVGNFDVQGVAPYFMQKYSNDAIRQVFPEMAEASDQQLSIKRAELIYDHLWKDTYMGIQLHEVGHSIGMLHVFSSSYDSPNYNPQYWQLRTAEGTAEGDCGGVPRPGGDDTCMGPRYLDPETDDEQGRAGEARPGINYWGHTSTMEYQNERFFEGVGLGSFDLHTVHALYGNVLQTFDPDYLPMDEQETFMARHFTQLTEQELAYYSDPASPAGSSRLTQSMHYTKQGRRMNIYGSMSCRDATDEERAIAEWRIVHGKVCTHPRKDYAAWRDFASGPAAPDLDSEDSIKVRVRPDHPSGANQVRWPYRWATSNNSYVHANPSDAGADVYEAVMSTIDKWEYSYLFTYFRRQNRDWYYRTIPARTAGRFYERLRATHWGIANRNAFYRSFGDQVFNQIAGNDDWWRPYIMAETEMFSAIARSLLMPQPGFYRQLEGNVYDPDGGAGGFSLAPSFQIDASTGRYIDPDFAGDAYSGGSWSYLNWVNWTGYTAEKSDAAKALTDGRAVFFTISRDNYLDGRNVNINFRSDMPQAIDRLLGGVLSADWESIAMHVPTGSGAGQYLPEPQMLDFGDASASRPGSNWLLFPNLGYKQQLGLVVWTQIFARLNSDLTLANKMRVWIDGLTGEFNVPEAQQVRFYNPESGLTYVARSYGTEQWLGRTIDRGIASRMIGRANDLLIGLYEVERDTNGDPIVDQFGVPNVLLDPDGQPTPIQGAGDLTDRMQDYRGYVGLLDSLVQVQDLVGYGPFNGLPTDFE